MGEPALQNDFFYPLINRQGENMLFIDTFARPFIEQFTVAEFVGRGTESTPPRRSR